MINLIWNATFVPRKYRAPSFIIIAISVTEETGTYAKIVGNTEPLVWERPTYW